MAIFIGFDVVSLDELQHKTEQKQLKLALAGYNCKTPLEILVFSGNLSNSVPIEISI